MNKSYTSIARWTFWILPLTILLALTLAATVQAAPLDQTLYTLTITTVGGGSVSSQPDQTSYLAGTFVNLTATAEEGYTFSGWSGACMGTGVCTVTMESDTTVTATFTLISGPGNDLPSFTSTPILTAAAGAPYTYFITAGDPDSGDSLTFSAPAIPGWLTLTPLGDGSALLTGTPDHSNLGAQIMNLYVHDASGAFATQKFILLVGAADTMTTGSIQGLVVDAEGNGIEGAVVTRASSNEEIGGASLNNQVTSSNGSYRFDAVPAGDYTIIVTLNGHESRAQVTVNLQPGQLAELPAITLRSSGSIVRLPMLYK